MDGVGASDRISKDELFDKFDSLPSVSPLLPLATARYEQSHVFVARPS